MGGDGVAARPDRPGSAPYDVGILSRLLVRVAILAASLAWAGFVFTQTIGDPGRGERIANAVLADDDARAEVAAPITDAVMRTAVLPPAQRPLVADQVDRLLQDPTGARSFVDPFAGSWARLLGDDDPRPAEFDLAPLLDQLATTDGSVPANQVADRVPVTDVPLPRVQLDWMGSVREAISVSLLPLALLATGAFVGAFVLGERRRVLRRLGIWAVTAGLVWVVLPPTLVWAARRWTPGADAVLAVSLDEAISGLFPVALGLVIAGVVVVGISFVVAPEGDRRPARDAARRTWPEAVQPAPTPTRQAAPTRQVPATSQVRPLSAGSAADPTAQMPTTTQPPAAGRPDDDRDPLWDYYGSS